MSKVVTIPTYQSPFVVMVNGVKYVFPAGSVQEVPDEVAVVIEANGRKKPEEPVDAPFDCCEGGGSGGGTQSDWNQTDSSAADFIKNKPFGDMPTGGDTLYWDGNTEGLEILDLGEEGAFYKISDTTPALAEAQQGGILATLDGVHDFTSEDIMAVSDTVYAIVSPSYLMVVLENNADLFGFTVPKKGCYSMDTAGISLTIPGYTGFPVTKKIEEKYLPGAVMLYSDGTYLYNTEEVTDAAKRTTKAELEKLLFSIQKICVGVDDGGMIYFTPDMYYEQENYMVASSSSAQLGFYTAEYVPEG